MIYAQPGTPCAIVSFKPRYGNFINGEFVQPLGGQYFTNSSPVNGQPIAEFPRSGAQTSSRPRRRPCRCRGLGARPRCRTVPWCC